MSDSALLHVRPGARATAFASPRNGDDRRLALWGDGWADEPDLLERPVKDWSRVEDDELVFRLPEAAATGETANLGAARRACAAVRACAPHPLGADAALAARLAAAAADFARATFDAQALARVVAAPRLAAFASGVNPAYLVAALEGEAVALAAWCWLGRRAGGRAMLAPPVIAAPLLQAVAETNGAVAETRKAVAKTNGAVAETREAVADANEAELLALVDVAAVARAARAASRDGRARTLPARGGWRGWLRLAPRVRAERRGGEAPGEE